MAPRAVILSDWIPNAETNCWCAPLACVTVMPILSPALFPALSPVERVRRFLIASEPFTIASGELTPTLKLRRHVIGEKYGAALEALYR